MNYPGQEHLLNNFREAEARGGLSHAYLFVGPSGLGQVEAAVWLAQLANCDGDGEPPCLICQACKLIAARNHPDVSWIAPSEKSKAGKLTIEQAREIRTEVSRRPVLARRKFVVLSPADELTLDAVNCMLKTLEEPPEYATLVLIASDTGNVPATILSRCQVARFLPVPAETLIPWLMQQGADRATAERLAALSEGRPGEALRLLNDPTALGARNRALDWLEQIARSSMPDAPRLAEQLRTGSDGETADLSGTLSWAAGWYRDVLALQSGLSDSEMLNQDRLDGLRYAAHRMPAEQTQRALAALPRTRRYLAGNGNTALVTEALLFDLIPDGGRA